MILQFIKYQHLIDNFETLYYIHKARISIVIAVYYTNVRVENGLRLPMRDPNLI